jgi:hypothetical protein
MPALPLVNREKLRYHGHMYKRNQHGGVMTILAITMLVLLLGGALAFGAWANNQRVDYKTRADVMIAAAVATARQQQQQTDTKQFAESEKSPLRTYDGPEAFGSLVVNYPKTWSAYVDDTGTGSALVDGYFNPGAVPALSVQGQIFALRVQVLAQSYNQVMQQFTSLQQGGQLSAATPYALPKVPKAVGVELSGKLPNGVTGTMVILPLRNQTLEISTYGSQNLGDFNKYILPNFSFAP